MPIFIFICGVLKRPFEIVTVAKVFANAFLLLLGLGLVTFRPIFPLGQLALLLPIIASFFDTKSNFDKITLLTVNGPVFSLSQI